MADFAKIVRASDGEQVLFFKDNGDNGPVLKQITEMDGITGALNLEFTDDDDGEAKRDAAFDRSDTEQADALRRVFAQALEQRE